MKLFDCIKKKNTRKVIFALTVGMMMVSCLPYNNTRFASDSNVRRIAPYVTCPADTIRMMLAAADSICVLVEDASLENLGLEDRLFNIPLKIRFHKEMPTILQLYATYDVVTNFPSDLANAPFAWHEIAKQQIADLYEKDSITSADVDSIFGAIDVILDDYYGGTQYDMNIATMRAIMMADYRLIDAYTNLFDQCQTPSLLESVHGSYLYLLDIYAERYHRVTSMGHWTDQPRELASMMIAMMKEKQEWVENLQSRLERGEITVKDISAELDARPADNDDWESLDY